MPNYLAPDIYVVEVSGGARPIEAVGASVAGFVGVAPDAKAHVNQAVAVNNWTEFTRAFFPEDKASTNLSHAVYGFFQNGGSRCYVVNVGANNPIGGARERTGLDVLEQIDEVAIVAAPGYTDPASYDLLLEHCETMEDRVAILDAPEQVADIGQLTKVGAAGDSGGAESGEDSPGLRPRQSDKGYGALYFPWLSVRDPGAPNTLIQVPPSGHMAGIWARTDATRGVHKAPANEAVRGALDLSYHVTRAEQELLNPAGVNCIRWFAAEGPRVWGARTLAPSGSEWRYLNVRRLFNVIKESIANSTRWIVFEPNDETLWKSIRRDVSAFLTLLWRDGALMGRTPEEAFFVKCDAETNPQEVIDAGRVVTMIGVAPVKPAEFIIFQLSQYAAGTDTEVQGG
ncbi:MAG: phage tail sheath family protein [Anaerolineae bacterium]